MHERYYWLGFSYFPQIGPKRFASLLSTFGSARDAWEVEESLLRDVIGPKIASQFVSFRKTFSLDGYVSALSKKKVQYVTLLDDAYPKLLKEISNPPFVLYVKGDNSCLSEVEGHSQPFDSVSPSRDSTQGRKYVGVVGTRKITTYGRDVTELLTQELVASNCIIVSGLAMGVDAIAHKTTIDSDGKTIAVLGCGVDCCNPRINKRLYEEIIGSGGAVVSEFPLSSSPTVGSFPSRNRIIAGLSHAVLVTEGAEDSGALITAEDAFVTGRIVFAVPGPITSHLSKGPYKLLAKGGILVTNAHDILGALGLEGKKKDHVIKGENAEEQAIIDLLQNEPYGFDFLVKTLQIASTDLSPLLSLMEMKGMIRSTETGEFVLVQ